MASFNKPNREFYRRLLFTEKDREKFLQALSHAISLGEMEKVRFLLNMLQKEGLIHALVKYRESSGETILHIAAKFNQNSEIIEELIKICPELLPCARKESDDYFGQTALHIAIAKGNIEAVESMLSEILNHSQSLKSALLHQLATGLKFVNTVMMGELPLSVAALTFNTNMVEALLINGAEMDRQNTKGDTVFHTLIKFAAIYPEKLSNVLTMLDFLHDHIKEKMSISYGKDILNMDYDHSDLTYIWFVPNNEDLNALQLTAALSQTMIFQYILNLPQVYCFLNSHDGLFDRKRYDITEIDTMATEKWAAYQNSRRQRMQKHVAPVAADGVAKRKLSHQTTSCSPFDLCRREMKKSILEMMFDIRSMAAFDFIQQSCVRQVIKQKWMVYRFYYYIWMVFHVFFMTTLTAYAVYKSDTYDNNKASVNGTMVTFDSSDQQETFIDVFQFIYLIIGILYLFHQIFHILFRVKSFDLVQFLNVLHNGFYRAALLLFSVCLILEFILSNAMSDYENYTLIIALITGWWFVVFFLRAHKKFSFFTVMIQKVIFGDMLRFGIIIALFLISFTAGLYMTFKGSEKEDFHNYGTSMLLLFKLMLGLGDIEDLYEARRPWLAVTLFVVFVLLTYVLMFNALIAMMSQTCNLVSENRHVQWRVQQLSIILFFEGILPSCMKKMVGTEKHVKRFDPNIKQVVEEKRYFLDLSSIQTEYASAEDIYAMKQKLQTLPFGDQQTGMPHFNLTIPTQNFMRSPRYSHAVVRTPQTERRSVRLNTAINVTPTSQERHSADYEESPKPKRKKSKREKSPSAIGSSHPDPTVSENQGPSKAPKDMRKRPKKKRVEPEGDNNITYEDHVPEQNLFYMNQHHLTVPEPITVSPSPTEVDRRRHHSEGGLIDTHIGPSLFDNPQSQVYHQNKQQHVHQQHVPLQQHKFPLKRVQLPGDQHGQMVPGSSPDTGIGALDIGVITDSYM